MKRLFLFISLFSVVALGGSPMPPTTKAADHSHRESAVVEFTDQVKLLNVFLKGKYLVVHDDELMARGEDCTSVYSLKAGKIDKLIVSFHCTPTARKKVETFTVRTARISNMSIYEVREIQFAGSGEAHRVPANQRSS